MKRLLLLAALALAAATPAYSQTLNFTLETSTSNGTHVVPRLTWTTAPGLAQCLASATPASTEWTGAKGTQGTVLLAATNTSRSYTMACTWPGNLTAVVRWTRPTANTDGTPLTNLAGYRVRYGTNQNDLTESALINDPATLTWTSATLAPGTWYFTVRSFNTLGLEGADGILVSKVLTSGPAVTRTLELGIKIPNAPPTVTVE